MTSTQYSEIYSRFLNKIEDYQIMQDIINDVDFAENLMLGYLRSAIPKYIYNTQDYTKRDDSTQKFNISLSDTEQEILATLMVVEYLSPKTLKLENLEQRLGSSDFRQYSPANLLKELRELRDNIKLEANDLMVFNYYKDGY